MAAAFREFTSLAWVLSEVDPFAGRVRVVLARFSGSLSGVLSGESLFVRRMVFAELDSLGACSSAGSSTARVSQFLFLRLEFRLFIFTRLS